MTWPTKKLGEICEERREKNINNENFPVFTVSHIYGLIPYQNIFYKQVHSKDTKNYKIVNRYDFAFGLPTKDTLPYGLLENEDKVLVSPAYVVFSIKNKNLLFPRFLYYLLKTNYYKWKIIEMAKSQSATRHGLPLKFHHLANLEIPLPPLHIQQKIVKILDTIQSAVEIQEKIIEKTKELKKSLANLLFHYGIKALSIKELASSRVGELTSSEIEKLGLKLKKTEIGEIPENWEVVRLGDVCEILSGGNAPQELKYFENGKYPFVRVQHLDGEKPYIEKWDLINEEAIKEYNLKLFPAETIIFPKSGASINLEKRAKLKIPSCIVNHLCALIVNQNKIIVDFVFYYLVTKKLSESSGGSTLPYLNLSKIKNFKTPLPPLPEQQEIAEILQTIDQKIEIEKKKKELYEELFKTMLNKIMSQEIDINLLNY
jgi:type I restriction enzyme S subunit